MRKRLGNAILWLAQFICPHTHLRKVGVAYEDIRIECIDCGKVSWRYSDDVPREYHEKAIERRNLAKNRLTN